MIIKKQVKVKWHGMSREHYESMGYVFTKKDDEFQVCASKLSSGSNLVVGFVCDYCGGKGERRFRVIIEARKVIPKDVCLQCSHKKGNEVKILNSGSLFERFPDLVGEWHPSNKKSPNQYNYGSAYRVRWLCNMGHEWEAVIKDRIKGKACPVCSESKGERRIRKWLTSNEYTFETEYTFEDLRGLGKGLLRFDFAIISETGELISLVEYDGEFHFKKIYEGVGHETIKYHDKLKDSYCKENSINLIRIPHTKFNELEAVLRERLGVLTKGVKSWQY